MTEQPLRVAVIGTGGFALEHHRALRALEEAGECRVLCTCDPDPDLRRAAGERWDFSGRGVRAFPDYVEMLDACGGALDMVTVPTPVPLHAPMHRACVERGLACYLEKPPTLDYAELEAMQLVEERAVRQTQVGFNFIVEEARLALKRRILAGEFGSVRRVCFRGLWPRPASYFSRASWAGRLMLTGRLVLDSCLGNAMAHYLHNALFWCGPATLFSWAEVVGMQAELYRAFTIEGTDTVFARGLCDGGTEVRVAATHACAGSHVHCEWVECERATLNYVTGQDYHIAWADGRSEVGRADGGDLLQRNFRAYFGYVRGSEPRPLTRLVDSRPFVHFNDLMYVAARDIVTIPDSSLRRAPSPSGDSEYRTINEIEGICDRFLTTGSFPSQQGVVWGKAGGEASQSQLEQLRAVIERLRL